MRSHSGTPQLVAANWSRPTGRSRLVAEDNWSRPTGRDQLVARDNWSRPTGRGIEKFIFRNHTQNFLLFEFFFLYYQLFSSHLTILFSKLGSLLHIHDLYNRFEGYTSIFKSNIVPTWQSKNFDGPKYVLFDQNFWKL